LITLRFVLIIPSIEKRSARRVDLGIIHFHHPVVRPSVDLDSAASRRWLDGGNGPYPDKEDRNAYGDEDDLVRREFGELRVEDEAIWEWT
jgi:hypothetical protein